MDFPLSKFLLSNMIILNSKYCHFLQSWQYRVLFHSAPCQTQKKTYMGPAHSGEYCNFKGTSERKSCFETSSGSIDDECYPSIWFFSVVLSAQSYSSWEEGFLPFAWFLHGHHKGWLMRSVGLDAEGERRKQEEMQRWREQQQRELWGFSGSVITWDTPGSVKASFEYGEGEDLRG